MSLVSRLLDAVEHNRRQHVNDLQRSGSSARQWAASASAMADAGDKAGFRKPATPIFENAVGDVVWFGTCDGGLKPTLRIARFGIKKREAARLN